jgi:hypothetical protein
MGRSALAVIILVVPLALAEEPRPTPAIFLLDRRGEVMPVRAGCTYLGGGTIDVRRPAADTVVMTMVGGVVATGHPCGSSAVMDFDLDQGFQIVVAGKLSLEAEAIGLLRGGRDAAASSGGGAAVSAGGLAIVAADLVERTVVGGENLTVNDKAAPEDVSIARGVYALRARWHIAASHPAGLRGKSASAEFAPEPALDPLWVGGPRDPFHGVAKKDFGLRVTLRVAPEPSVEPAWKAVSPASRP